MEALTTLVGGLIVALASRWLERGATTAQVRVFVIIACLVGGVGTYLLVAGPPTTLKDWSAISVFASGSFGVAAALYKWVLNRPLSSQQDNLRDLTEHYSRNTWI